MIRSKTAKKPAPAKKKASFAKKAPVKKIAATKKAAPVKKQPTLLKRALGLDVTMGVEKPAVSATNKNHYVNNVEFYQEMIQFRIDNADRIKQGLRPNISNSIGKKILEICTRLSFKFNFIKYSFREDMISDAIQNCINYIWNFNPEKGKNPFSYFTLIAYRAFVRRIQREKKIMADRQKYMNQILIELETESNGLSDEEKSIAKEIEASIFGDRHAVAKDPGYDMEFNSQDGAYD
jgi:hypothetical protein